MKSQALEEMLAILTAGGRNSGEISRALPRKAYQDPARHVKFERERKLKSIKKMKKAKHRIKGK